MKDKTESNIVDSAAFTKISGSHEQLWAYNPITWMMWHNCMKKKFTETHSRRNKTTEYNCMKCFLVPNNTSNVQFKRAYKQNTTNKNVSP